ncbi:diguanylate cyclase/phosphodiesterase (GGDEF & EAL domains) with PAS/PAC sensor(s) [hydrothermal vent metagenome]|uniref:Diguanylate cyclase/phosphodiesterase (GGDEF & EAL domains) with PAS/PAC sensor(S) n=1 Tax=hydrothermal vent metagenome TaxID=652676 RepID=A0A3B0WY48_9ZZZZ
MHTDNKPSPTRLMQTALLFKGLSYSTAGSLIVALSMVYIIGPYADQLQAWKWLSVLAVISLYRWITYYTYSHQTTDRLTDAKWGLNFKVGAYAAAVTWGSAMWLFYPDSNPEYQVLVILGLAGVSGGALAVLSYDSRIITYYQAIILVFIESRLLWENEPFAIELAVLSLFYFGFLMKGGHEIGQNYSELIKLRYDTEKHNLALLSTTEEIARIGYWQWDMKSRNIELSSSLAKMCNTEQINIDMKTCFGKVHTDDRRRVKQAIDYVVETGKNSTVEYRIQNTENDEWTIMNQIIKRIENAQGGYSILGTVQDISIIKSAEKKIFDMAYFDELTGLANRNHFHQHLDEQIKHARRKDRKLAILYIDLDGFKEINDTLGHDRGDEYLKIIANRLKYLLRDIDFVARLGGDEFCIILEDIHEGIDASIIAERCLALSKSSIMLDNQKITPKMSIGIAVYPDDGTQTNTLLKAADTAMYSAKHDGKHACAFYDPQMTSDSIARLQLEADLQTALLNNEFELWYQPKIALNTGRMSGVEALIRWQHPQRGLIAPDYFISTAERIGLINKIGEWVLITACKQLQQWKQMNIELDIAINISSAHFSSEGFAEKVEQVTREFNLAPGDLEIEITESQTRNPKEHINICHQLQKNGIKIAIDDFGTGYSSLSVLKQLEIDTLKVDREFIRELPDEPAAALMVSTIVNMSLAMGYSIVAEGVETQEQAEFLSSLGCPIMQGYYFSKPVPAPQIKELVNTHFNLYPQPTQSYTENP